jgi:soluble lytic murein transglycosylase-like protein
MVSKIAGAALLLAIMSNFALADCFDRAGSYYSIDPDYLRAISWQESRFNNAAINGKSAGGTTDYCMMQINSRTLADLRREYPSSTRISSTQARACVFMLVLCFYGVILTNMV